MASRNPGWRAFAVVMMMGLQAESGLAGEKPVEQGSPDRAPRGLAEQLECLALNIYWEARSEPVIGQLAVAAVTLNRVADPGYPDSVCEVVYQGGENAGRGCQFSWWCDGKPDRPRETGAWTKAVEMALSAASMALPDPTGGALWYHAEYVDPLWARSKRIVARIGRHLFFSEHASNDELIAAAR